MRSVEDPRHPGLLAPRQRSQRSLLTSRRREALACGGQGFGACTRVPHAALLGSGRGIQLLRASWRV